MHPAPAAPGPVQAPFSRCRTLALLAAALMLLSAAQLQSVWASTPPADLEDINADAVGSILSHSNGTLLVTSPSNGTVLLNGVDVLAENVRLTATVSRLQRAVAGLGLRQWTQLLGTPQSDRADGVATDADRNVIVVGRTDGTLDGNGTTGAAGTDMVVAKYTRLGARLWVRQLGSNGTDHGNAVATDGDGNVYIVGTCSSAFDGQTPLGGTDVFLSKLDSAGTRLWTRQLGTAADDVGTGVVTDSKGDVFVAGSTKGSLAPGNSHVGLSDVFVAKYSGSGSRLWAEQLGTTTTDVCNAAAVDHHGNVFVTGRTGGALQGNSSAGSWDVFVAKFAGPSGTQQWVRQLGSIGAETPYGVATDSKGNVYVAGDTTGDLDGNTNAGGSGGGADLFATKFDSAGNLVWTRQMGTGDNDIAQAVAVDGDDNVYLAGVTDGALLGNLALGDTDLFLVKLDSSGSKLWARQLGTRFQDSAYAVATDSSGNAVVAGFTDGNLDGQASAGGRDLFVMMFGLE